MESKSVQLPQSNNDLALNASIQTLNGTPVNRVFEQKVNDPLFSTVSDRLPFPRPLYDNLVTVQQQRRSGVQDSPEITAFLNNTHSLVEAVFNKVIKNLPEHFGAIDSDDLLQEARMGLFEALESFEPERGLSFNTYAPSRIRGRMIDALRNNDHLPRSIRLRQKNLTEKTHALSSLESSAATIPERAKVDYHGQFSGLSSISVPLFDDKSEKASSRTQCSDTLLSSSEMPPDYRETRAEFWRTALRGLNTQERLIVLLYFREGLTMKEIGNQIDLSESRVSQMMTKLAEDLVAKAKAHPDFLADLDGLYDALSQAEEKRKHIQVQGEPLSLEQRTVEAFMKSGTLPSRGQQTLQLQEDISNIGLLFEIVEDKAISLQSENKGHSDAALDNLLNQEVVSTTAEKQLNELSQILSSLGLNLEVTE